MKASWLKASLAGAMLLTATGPAIAAELNELRAQGLTLLDDRKSEQGFLSLFNGRDLSGWNGDSKLWSVKEGAITGQTTREIPAPGNTFLIWTNGEVGDFELRCSFKLTANNDQNFANSGIQYRSKVLDPVKWVVGGYQADMEAGSTYTGILYEERMTRGIMAARGEKVVWDKDCKKQVTGSLGQSEELQKAIRQGDWNDYTIVAQGNHLQHFVNGKQTVDVTDECEAKQAFKGVLALQLHAGLPMTVQFRNLRLRGLPPETGAAADLKHMQGVWEVTAVKVNGEPRSLEDVGPIVVTIKDNSYTLVRQGSSDQGTFTLDPAKSPKQMDILPQSGETLPAIYAIGPDSFKVCYPTGGSSRPAGFETSQDSGSVLVTYKRKN